MSLKAIFDFLKESLPQPLQAACYFGLRNLPQHAGAKRIVFVPDREAIGPATRIGTTDPQQLFSRASTCQIYLEAPNTDEIETLIALVLTALYPALQGSVTPIVGEWQQQAAQSVRGELYILSITFGVPVVRTITTAEITSEEIQQDVIDG